MFWLYPSFALLLAGSDPAPASAPAVTLGLEVLLTERLDLVAGKRLGLLTHPAGVDAELVPSVDRLVAAGRAHGFKVVQLYGPEHGIRGWMSAAEKTGADVDPFTKLPVENLFGLGKRGRPSKRSLERIDVLVVDLQDLGSRTYTYISTLGEAMIAAGEAGKPVIVLDRPNPAGGLTFEGPVLRHKRRSFVGWAGLPVTHGMTLGEIAEFYRRFEDVTCDLVVVPMRGWRRDMTWAETGLPWVPTSPGIPHVDNALLYPATGMIGGVTKNVSEGVGTTLPFEQVGAEWIDAPDFERALTTLNLPGVRFRATTFRPNWFDHKGKLLHGVQLVLTDRRAFRPIRTALALLVALESLYPSQAVYRDNFDTIWGGSQDLIERARTERPSPRTLDKLEAGWSKRLEAFAAERGQVLRYPQ
jgi:uncharacterized protein YbbC (DUF1343 family)